MSKEGEIEENMKSLIHKHSVNEALHIPAAWWNEGAKYQRERLNDICEYALSLFDGDIVEIGADRGETTVYFCKLAEKYKRKVIVVDPWNGDEGGDEDCYKDFLRNNQKYIDSGVLIVLRKKSQSMEVITELKKRNVAFSFVDGLHEYGAAAIDILSCLQNNSIIAVDDTLSWRGNQNPSIKKAYYDIAHKYGIKFIYDGRCRESYYYLANEKYIDKFAIEKIFKF